MKASFLATATYGGPAPGPQVWPAPPGLCDRELASESLQYALDACRRADELGFDWVSLSEHHYAPVMLTPNPMVMAGAVSQVTSRCKIALLGPLLPLANPVRTAEEIAMLDSLSGGRIVVCFLRGTPSEHRVYADVAAPSRAMTQEGIELILKAWTSEEPFSWQGEHFHFDTVSVWPRCRQTPHPPVFASGNSLDSATFAGERRLGLAISFAPIPVLKRFIAAYLEAADRAGWSPTSEHIIYRAIGHVAETDEAAMSDLARVSGRDPADLAALYAAPADLTNSLAHIHRPFILGSPATVQAQVRSLHDAGVGLIDVAFQSGIGLLDRETQAQSTALFAREVLPEMRRW